MVPPSPIGPVVVQRWVVYVHTEMIATGVRGKTGYRQTGCKNVKAERTRLGPASTLLAVFKRIEY